MSCTKKKPASEFALCLSEPASGMRPESELVQAESDVCTGTVHIQYFSEKKKINSSELWPCEFGKSKIRGGSKKVPYNSGRHSPE